MESLTLTQANNAIAKTVSINAVTATKIAGVRINKPSRALHTSTPMTTTGLNMTSTTNTKKSSSSFPSIQTKTYATQAPSITGDAAAKSDIDVEGWIKKHYTPYEGDGSFLSGPTEKTKKTFC
jgi:formate C-acetyltransferase